MAYGNSPFGFEDLEVYKVARELRKRMYGLVKILPQEEKYALGQQIRRAAISLTNNMAEGYGRFNWQESIQFFRHSRGSLLELMDDLKVCEDEGYADEEFLGGSRKQAESVLRLINGYINYLKRGKDKTRTGAGEAPRGLKR